MKTRKSESLKIGKHVRTAAFFPATVVEENRTVEIAWSSGSKGSRYSYEHGEYYEELSMEPSAVKLDRLNNGAPFLKVHNNYELEAVIGVVQKAWIQDGMGRAIVQLSDRADVEWIWKDIKSGVLRNISVGYNVELYLDVSLPNDDVRTFRAIQWEPLELSLVPIGFDAKAQVRSGEPEERTIELLVEDKDETTNLGQQAEEITIPNERNHEMPPEDLKKQKEEAAAEGQKTGKETERKRVLDIKAAVRQAKMDPSLAEEFITQGTEIDQVRADILERMGKATAPVEPVLPRVEIIADIMDKTRTGMANAILHRALPAQQTLSEQGREFRGMTLVDMAREILETANMKTRGLTKHEIAKRALSSSDFPLLLQNVAGKSLRDAYQLAPQTFRSFVKIGTLPDYKAVSRVQFGDVSSLAVVNENGEYSMGTIGEGAESYSVAKYGKVIPISDVVIVNDDLQALSRLPAMMGAAAGRLESKLVYDILMNNAAMADGVALFHATHGNLEASGTAVLEASVSSMEKKMMEQMTTDKTDYLNLLPKFLLTGTAYKTAAQRLLGSMVATKSTDVNPYLGAYTPIVDPRVTGNKWFLIADPAQVDTIELGYLEGENGPQMDSEIEFMTDAVKFKVKHVVGAKAIDWRGMVYNPGA